MQRFTDLAFERDDEGIYDLVIDAEARDFKTTAGIDTALLMTFFTDRRARPDEVADPMRRRGWLGNLSLKTPGDNFGSGIWLYEQRRLTGQVRAALRLECINAAQWLIDEGLGQSLDVTIDYSPSARRVQFQVDVREAMGGVTSRAFRLWADTRSGTLVSLQ